MRDNIVTDGEEKVISILTRKKKIIPKNVLLSTKQSCIIGLYT
jgi:hypothetical protein